MKIWTLCVCVLTFNLLMVNAQNSMWGVTARGGDGDEGVIFQMDNSGNNFEVKKSFFLGNDADKANEFGQFAELGATNVLYGVTTGGGSGSGVILKYDVANNIMEKVYAFNVVNCSTPEAPLMWDEATQKFYGTTTYSASDATFTSGTGGAIYSFEPATKVFTVLYKFNITKGNRSYSKLCKYGNALYGTTRLGGANSVGVLFKYELGTSDVTVLHDFENATTKGGAEPYGGVVEVGGKLYGATTIGGNSDFGVIYQYDLGTSTYSVRKHFSGYSTDGSFMKGHFVADGTTLYGLTNGDGDATVQYGTIISFNTSNDALTKLYAMDIFLNGILPMGSLVKNGNKLICVTSEGFATPIGAVISFEIGGSASTTAFSSSENNMPAGALQITSTGKLLGLLSKSEDSDRGGIYEYTNTLGIDKKLDFGVSVGGRRPVGKLTRGSDGLLYGVMSEGGDNSGLAAGGIPTGGTLFSYDPVNDLFVTEHQFAAGSVPNGDMILIDNRELYGMSERGGTNDFGYIYKYNVYNDEFTVVDEFTGANGKFPKGGLSLSNGKLYGLTSESETGAGAVIELVPVEYGGLGEINAVSTFTTNSNGGLPYGNLVEAGGTLYSMLMEGPGGNPGAISSFDGSDLSGLLIIPSGITAGGTPYGSFVNVNGILYGGMHGALNNNTELGALIKFDPSNPNPGGDYILPSSSVLHTFTGNVDANKRGAKPIGTMALSDNGKLYGFTSYVPNTEVPGVIYEFDPNSDTYKSLIILEDTKGAMPGRNAELSLVCAADASFEYSYGSGICTANQTGASYQWYKRITGDDLMEVVGATGQSFNAGDYALGEGVYCVKVTYGGCSNLSDYYFYGDFPVNGHMAKNSEKIKVYPNPASGKLFINANNSISDIDIMNLAGKVIYSKGNLNPHMGIDISELKVGVYFISFTTVDKRNQTLKFIKK